MARKELFSLVMLLFLVYLIQVEAEICWRPSNRYRGICYRDGGCASICKGEGFEIGRCRFRRRCMCGKDCGGGGGGGGSITGFAECKNGCSNCGEGNGSGGQGGGGSVTGFAERKNGCTNCGEGNGSRIQGGGGNVTSFAERKNGCSNCGEDNGSGGQAGGGM